MINSYRCHGFEDSLVRDDAHAVHVDWHVTISNLGQYLKQPANQSKNKT